MRHLARCDLVQTDLNRSYWCWLHQMADIVYIERVGWQIRLVLFLFG